MIKTKRIRLFSAAFLLCFTSNAQQFDLPKNYLGFGWLVSFPYDDAFIPSEKTNSLPTVEEFFKQKTKYGVRLNEEDSVIAAIRRSNMRYNIKWHTGDTSYIKVVPVLAYYSLDYVFDNVIDTTSDKKPYSEMLQVYYYRNKVDSVFYRFGMDYNFQFRPIEGKNKTKN